MTFRTLPDDCPGTPSLAPLPEALDCRETHSGRSRTPSPTHPWAAARVWIEGPGSLKTAFRDSLGRLGVGSMEGVLGQSTGITL